MVDNFDSGVVAFLEQLKAFTENVTANLIMPTRVQKGDGEEGSRAPQVFTMRLPDSAAAAKKAPYVIHQLLTTKEIQPPGQKQKCSVVVRSIFCVYNDDEQEGGLMLLNLVERIRIALLRAPILGSRYKLDVEVGVESLIYTVDSAPYYSGEMVTTWEIPAIEREVRQWL